PVGCFVLMYISHVMYACFASAVTGSECAKGCKTHKKSILLSVVVHNFATTMSPGLELAKCMAIALAAWILPRSFLAPVVACGAVQLWSMMQQCLRTSDKPKKIHEFENFLATVQTLCDRRNFSILAAVVVILVYLALGDSIKTSHFLLSAAFQAALAFSLGILVAAILPEKEEVQEPYNCPCGMKCGSSSEDSCPYGADFWSDFEENEKVPEEDHSKDLIDVLFLRKKC
ncbi:Uncharacterized protein SCF082_LOCUS36984, partial [Durusdinium trenchii]